MLVVHSATVMLVDLSVAIMQVTVSVTIMQLEVSAAFMQLKISAANMWVTIFIEIMEVGVVSVSIMHVFSAVHYAHDIVIMQVTVSVVAMYLTVRSSNFIFLSLTPTFHKIDQETIKGIISSLHFTDFDNILPKLRCFVGRDYIQIG